MIWSYYSSSFGGELIKRFGVPVSIVLPDVGRTEVVYQFGGGGQQCAVVHWQSGGIIAPIGDEHKGNPTERAQAAIDTRLLNHVKGRVGAILAAAQNINQVPEIVGRFR